MKPKRTLVAKLLTVRGRKQERHASLVGPGNYLTPQSGSDMEASERLLQLSIPELDIHSRILP